MRKILLVTTILILISNSLVFADVKLFRFTDKITGDEHGICYSDKDGNPQNNPDWNSVEITESQKQTYINLQNQQLKQKQDVQEAANVVKKNKAITKLKQLGLSDDEVSAIIK